MKKPVIGLTLDSSEEKTFSDYPWYALRKNYCSSIAELGGIPLPLPHQEELIDSYLDLLDGLIITGGRFDHDPNFYGVATAHPKSFQNNSRSHFEFKLLHKALGRKMPFLGICAGEQLLNIAYGGTLVQYIPDEVPQALVHLQEKNRHLPSHSVQITPGTKLAKIYPALTDTVNTSHQQAIKALGMGLVSNAMAPDGIIEGVEDPKLPFCIGVQWHPEFLVCDLDRALLLAFLKAAS
jgi:putative glutamine amidotransferase